MKIAVPRMNEPPSPNRCRLVGVPAAVALIAAADGPPLLCPAEPEDNADAAFGLGEAEGAIVTMVE